MSLEKCVDKLKMLRGLKPYNTSSNFCYGDGYFAESIKKEFSKEMIAEALEIIEEI